MGPSAKLGYMSENTRQTGLWASLAILSGLGPEDPGSRVKLRFDWVCLDTLSKQSGRPHFNHLFLSR